MCRQLLLQRLLGEQYPWLGLVQNEGEAVSRVIEAEREVSAASFEGSEHGDEQIEGAFQVEAHETFGADAPLLEMMSQLVGAGVEVTISKMVVCKDERDGVGCLFHLSAKEAGDGSVPRKGCCGGIPVNQQVLAFSGSQVRDVGKAVLGRGKHAFEECLQVVQQTVDTFRREAATIIAHM